MQGPTFSEISSTLHSSGFRNNNPHGGVRGSAVQKTGKKEPPKKDRKRRAGVQNRTKSLPKRTKMAPKCFQNGVRGPSGTHAGIRAEQGAEKNQLRGTSGLHFGAQNGPKSLQKRIPKKDQKTTSKKEAWGSILDNFRRIFRGFLVPKRSRRRARIDFNEKSGMWLIHSKS